MVWRPLQWHNSCNILVENGCQDEDRSKTQLLYRGLLYFKFVSRPVQALASASDESALVMSSAMSTDEV